MQVSLFASVLICKCPDFAVENDYANKDNAVIAVIGLGVLGILSYFRCPL